LFGVASPLISFYSCSIDGPYFPETVDSTEPHNTFGPSTAPTTTTTASPQDTMHVNAKLHRLSDYYCIRPILIFRNFLHQHIQSSLHLIIHAELMAFWLLFGPCSAEKGTDSAAVKANCLCREEKWKPQ